MKLHDQKASIGYFSDSGTHTLANMSYASLAFIHEFPVNGKHEYRPIIGQIKPFKGESSQRQILKTILGSFIKLDSRLNVEDVLEHIGRVWQQRGKDVFGNTALLVVTNNPTPLVDTGELKDNFGYRTSFDYTLRYA